MAPRFEEFKSAVTRSASHAAGSARSGCCRSSAGSSCSAALAVLLGFLAIDGWRSVYPRWSDVVLIGLAVCAVINAAILVGALTQRRLWRQRSREANAEAERWEAFRRYLTDFPRLQEAPPATLALWERFLVYGIAFGIAERVLQGAQLDMPQAIHQASSIYWISGSAAISARARPRSRSAISRRVSGARSHRRTRVAAGSAAASRAAAAGAAAAEAAASARARAGLAARRRAGAIGV